MVGWGWQSVVGDMSGDMKGPPQYCHPSSLPHHLLSDSPAQVFNSSISITVCGVCYYMMWVHDLTFFLTYTIHTIIAQTNTHMCADAHTHLYDGGA